MSLSQCREDRRIGIGARPRSGQKDNMGCTDLTSLARFTSPLSQAVEPLPGQGGFRDPTEAVAGYDGAPGIGPRCRGVHAWRGLEAEIRGPTRPANGQLTAGPGHRELRQRVAASGARHFSGACASRQPVCHGTGGAGRQVHSLGCGVSSGGAELGEFRGGMISTRPCLTISEREELWL
jgi:hypothetical protein